MVNLSAEIRNTLIQKKRISISGITPYYFKQLGGEKLSYSPQELILDFRTGNAFLSPEIALVVAMDPEILIHSNEFLKTAFIINLGPLDYPDYIGASIMISEDKLIVVDTDFGMNVKMIYNKAWSITVS